MKLKQLVYFASVAENGSFNAASKALFVAQSSLSTTVAELERELGFDLLVRTRKGVSLTGMGKIVYGNIKEVLNIIDGYEEKWQDIYSERSSINTPIVAAIVPSLYQVFTKKVVEELKVDYPNLNIAVFEGRGPLLHEYMSSGKVDMIFSDIVSELYEDEKTTLEKAGYVVNEIGSDVYKYATREDKGGVVSVEEVNSMPFICYSGGDVPSDMFVEHGISSAKKVEYNSIEKMYNAVLAGNCGGCLPEKASLLTAKFEGRQVGFHFNTLEGFDVPFIHYGCFNPEPEIEKIYRIIEERFKTLLESV